MLANFTQINKQFDRDFTTADFEVSEYFRNEHQVSTPPDDMTCSEWAERYRVLSASTTSDSGPWENAKSPVSKGIMDAISSGAASYLTVCGATQVTKTESAVINPIGYLIHKRPASILMMYPTKVKAKSMLRDRIKPMVEHARDGVLTDRLNGKIVQDGFTFAGGNFYLGSAESEGSISSYPVKYLFIDEADEIAMTAKYGDPIAVAEERTKSFVNSIIVKIGKPLAEDGHIQTDLKNADYLFYPYVPCPHCGGMFRFVREGLYPQPESKKDWDGIGAYQCPICAEKVTDSDKPNMILSHVWQTEEGIRLETVLAEGFRLRLAFHLNSFYSMKISFTRMLGAWLDAKGSEDKVRVYTEGWLALPYINREVVENLSANVLMKRVENYTPEMLPAGVCALTSFADVQANRLEALTMGWAPEYENWSIDRKVFWGQPTDPGVWRALFNFMLMPYPHPCGTTLRPVQCMVDSKYRPDLVRKFIFKYKPPRTCMSQGSQDNKAPLLSPPRKMGMEKIVQFYVNTHEIKKIIHGGLSAPEGEPNNMHFGAHCDEPYFTQLLSERLVREGKFPRETERWEKVHTRNEVWDMTVGNYATLLVSGISLEEYANIIYGYFTAGGKK